VRLKKEIFCGDLLISTEDDSISMLLDPQTGMVREFKHPDATLHEISSFMTKAKAAYNKFMISEEAEKFKY